MSKNLNNKKKILFLLIVHIRKKKHLYTINLQFNIKTNQKFKI